MKKIEIAILGAGNGGRAFAVYLAKKGFKVNLGFRTPKNIHEIYISKRVISTGEINGTFKMNKVINNNQLLIQNAKFILVVVPANVQLELVRKIIPFLKNNQIILLNPGRTFGAIEIYNEIKFQRPELNIHVGETQSLLFTCRKIRDYGVEIYKIKNQVQYCFYPESSNPQVKDLLDSIFPELKQVDDIRITSLNNIGAVIHPAVVLLNTGSITRPENFLFYREGVVPPIARMIEQVDRERLAIQRKLGLPKYSLLDWVEDVYGTRYDDYYEAFQKIKSYETILAPQGIKNRYLTEDVPTGLVPLWSLGRKLGIRTTAIKTLINLADLLLGTDFRAKGRTIENVGIPMELLQNKNSLEIVDEFLLDISSMEPSLQQ
jgi:opine dehydrogenase